MKKEVLRMDHVLYKKDGVTYLNNFNLQIFQGEVMGLVPLDAIGLDALINLLAVNDHITYGYIYMNDILINRHDKNYRGYNRVYVISNENNLIEELSAAENIFVLRKGFKRIFLSNKEMVQQLHRLIDELGLHISIDKPVKKLSSFERYVLQIIKAVISKASLVILQDLSSFVNIKELIAIYQVIRYYADKNISFIYISVQWEQLQACCDRIALMSNGRIIKCFNRSNLSEPLKRKIEVQNYNIPARCAYTKMDDPPIVFACQNLCYRYIRNLSMAICKGECVVLYDEEKKISEDLVHILTFEKPFHGEIVLNKKAYRRSSLKKIGIILEDPCETMLFKEMSYGDNLCFGLDGKIPSIWSRSKTRKLVAKEAQKEDNSLMPTMNIRFLSVRQKYDLIYRRVHLQHPDIVFCFNPFTNADLQAKACIQNYIVNLTRKNISVVIITINLSDSLKLADRLILIHNGQNKGVLYPDEFKFLN